MRSIIFSIDPQFEFISFLCWKWDCQTQLVNIDVRALSGLFSKLSVKGKHMIHIVHLTCWTFGACTSIERSVQFWWSAHGCNACVAYFILPALLYWYIEYFATRVWVQFYQQYLGFQLHEQGLQSANTKNLTVASPCNADCVKNIQLV